MPSLCLSPPPTPRLGTLCLPEAAAMKVMVVAAMEGESRGGIGKEGVFPGLYVSPVSIQRAPDAEMMLAGGEGGGQP